MEMEREREAVGKGEMEAVGEGEGERGHRVARPEGVRGTEEVAADGRGDVRVAERGLAVVLPCAPGACHLVKWGGGHFNGETE